ncbi:MAG: T9SS type A sorting domain-containing protein [Bacteroidales bacterium]|nr:T9SS type A sorting domain-containing protein [Bacteroidales bacterium]
MNKKLRFPFNNRSLALFLIFPALFFFNTTTARAQCDITASASANVVCSGDTVSLSADGVCYDLLAVSTFNNGTIGTGWSSSEANPVFTNPCGPGPNGAHLWVGTTNSQVRTLVSVDYDVSIGNCTINWWMRYGKVLLQGDCEDPDEPYEGVHLQYSTNNGTTWTDFPGPDKDPVGPNDTVPPFNTDTAGTGGYWEPDGVPPNPPTQSVYYWHEYESDVPAVASTSSTRFRWAQLSTSAQGYDAWGIDEVEIKCFTDSNLVVNWDHGPTQLSPPSVTLPSQGTTPYDTCFIVTVSDSINSATDSVCITVNPNPDASLPDTILTGNDTLVLDPGSGYDTYFWNTGSYKQILKLYGSQMSTGTYNYWVEVTNAHGCPDTAYSTIEYSSVGIHNHNSGKWNVYPNPTKDIITIELSNVIQNSSAEFRLLSSDGALIRRYEWPEQAKEHQINLSGLSKGIYWLELELENKTLKKKLIKR